MFRPYMWAIFRLRSNFLGAAIQGMLGVFWVLVVGWRRGARSRLLQYHDLGRLQVDYL